MHESLVLILQLVQLTGHHVSVFPGPPDHLSPPQLQAHAVIILPNVRRVLKAFIRHGKSLTPGTQQPEFHGMCPVTDQFLHRLRRYRPRIISALAEQNQFLSLSFSLQDPF